MKEVTEGKHEEGKENTYDDNVFSEEKHEDGDNDITLEEKILMIFNMLQKKNVKKLTMILLRKKRKHNNVSYNY